MVLRQVQHSAILVTLISIEEMPRMRTQMSVQCLHIFPGISN
ncbi:hypothetical protein EMIT0111MI5_340020 [Burkholderia sp. IT-111MI5]